ncbi:hypothetical protein A0J61_05635 [Choanephora cucurbitarum]|uniref:Uncharacterized protein n=1 Tax=Choanephora cucurbitarum TaxID=101091 RepID=A0A1C7NCL3_9FUNG|nr:hypothetical protein A0J61_05635 [Choanephora cucurbitarum]
MSMRPSLCVGSFSLGQDPKWQEKSFQLCLFHGDPHNPPIPQYQVSFALKGIVDTKAVSLYMYDHWRWEAYSVEQQNQFFQSVFGDHFDVSQTTTKALILQMDHSDSSMHLILYGQKDENELTLYAHRLRPYHEFVSIHTESTSESSMEEAMMEQLTKTEPALMMPLPKPSSLQKPSRSHSQQQLPAIRSQKNVYQANKNLLKQCIKHELARQMIQDAELFQVVYHDMTYHYKEKLHTALMTEQQFQIPSKMFVDFHFNFKAMLQ